METLEVELLSLVVADCASSGITMSTWNDWYLGKKFSSDWTSRHFEIWAEHLARFSDTEVSVLEIGSWEGRSAIFFLNFLRRSRLTCIEPFAGSSEHSEDDALSTLEERFDTNLAPFGARVEKIKSRSLPALDAGRRRILAADTQGPAAAKAEVPLIGPTAPTRYV